MAISDRQAAAIHRRKRQERFDREQADERRRLALVMPADAEQPTDPDLVGWLLPATDTMKGRGHLCILCHPWRPLGYKPVMRNLLAARMPCTHCQTVLETIVRPAVEKK